MADIRRVTDHFAVAPQLTPQDLSQAAAEGFVLVVNNRPDAEVDPPLSGAALAKAAQAAGLAYVHIPVTGMATPEQCEAMYDAVSAAGGPALAFCRSGTRSITTWARGQQAYGRRDRIELMQAADAAGYDLSAVLR